MIEFLNLKFRYIKGFPLLNNITFNIDNLEKKSLLGVRGSGKTTIAKILCKEIEKYDGLVAIDGVNIKDESIKDLNICYICDDYLLSNKKTVRENCKYGLILRKTPINQIENLVNIALDNCNILDIADKKVREIPIEQRFLTALARGMARNPKLVILDDVFLSLQLKERLQMIQKVKNVINSLNCNLLFMTEDIEQIEIMNFNTAVINYGEIFFDGNYSDYQNKQ